MNKENNIKNKIIFIVLAFIFLFILLCSFNTTKAAEKYDYIIIGDSRTVGIHQTLTGDYSKIVVKDSVKVNNKEVMFLGAGSQEYAYWFSNSSNYSSITNSLKNAKDGAKCIAWLGVNGLSHCSEYITALNNLATNYPNVKFYCYSVTAVNRNLYMGPITNTAIDNYNENLSNAIKSKSRYNKNLFYEDIQNKKVTINGTTKTVKKWITDDTSQTGDGLHYYTGLNKAILTQTMLTNTNNNETGTSNTTVITITEGEAREEKEFTDVFEDISTYEPSDKAVSAEINDRINIVLTVITNIGMIVAVLVSAVLGVKYLIGSVEGTNDYSKDLVPYLIGSALTFGICVIIKILQQIG